MKLHLFSPYDRPLVMTREKAAVVCEVYDRHVRGNSADIASLRAEVAAFAVRQPKDTGGEGYTVQDGVALIDVEGIISKRMNIFAMISGGCSTDLLQNDVNAAVADPKVHSILLCIDSPGGTVDGVQSAGDAIAAAGKVKPTASWVNGMACSGGYWLASQTQQIFLAEDATTVGSIGVVIEHRDRSGADAQAGLKRTEVTSGKYKRIASSTKPLSEEGEAYLQTQCDHIYDVFVETVAEGRGVSPETVDADMADGRVFLGQKAVDAGLADGIKSLDEVIALLVQEQWESSQQTGARASATRSTGEASMKTYTEDEFNTAVAAAVERGKVEGQTAGATAERERIQGVMGAAMPGHGDLIKRMAFDGKTQPGDAALAVVAAERKALEAAGTDLEADAPKPAPAAEANRADEAKAAVEAGKPVNDRAQGTTLITAQQISAHQAKARTEGRTLSTTEALRELRNAEKQ